MLIQFGKIYQKIANLKWIGYWGSDYDWQKGKDAYALESILSTNTTNISFICGWEPADIELSLNRCKENNMQVFLRWHLGYAGFDTEAKKPEYIDFLQKYDDIIYGFYIDEPWWNKIPEDVFKNKTKFIRDNYPTKELLVVMAVAEFSEIASAAMAIANFDPNNEFAKDVAPKGYYDYCTLLSFDFHTTLGTYGNKEADGALAGILSTLYETFIEDLIKLKNDNQRLWFCAKGFWIAPSDTSFNNPLENKAEHLKPGDDIISILKHHYMLAQKHEDFEGICFYSWESGPPFVGDESTWGIALEAFMRQDITYTKEMFSFAGDEYAGNHYREDLVKHFQQLPVKLY